MEYGIYLRDLIMQFLIFLRDRANKIGNNKLYQFTQLTIRLRNKRAMHSKHVKLTLRDTRVDQI